MKTGVIIVSAGCGRRFGRKDKATAKLGGKPLFMHSFEVFDSLAFIEQIVLVLRKSNFQTAGRLIKSKKLCLCQGGKERQDSVANGLKVIRKDLDYVLIHDGARPFPDKKIISGILKSLRKYPGAICGSRSADTVKSIKNSMVEGTLERKNIFFAQTPQGFRKDAIVRAYSRFNSKNFTDDSQFLEVSGEKVKIVYGDKINFKITYPQDLILARALLRKKSLL